MQQSVTKELFESKAAPPSRGGAAREKGRGLGLALIFVLLEQRFATLLLIPAGVAHRNEGESADFRAVGAYPRGMQVDMRYGRADERRSDERRLARVPPPSPDPVFGSGTPARSG